MQEMTVVGEQQRPRYSSVSTARQETQALGKRVLNDAIVDAVDGV